MANITDLPLDILQRILQSVCEEKQEENALWGVSMTRVKCLSRVCTTWREVVPTSYKRATCQSLFDEDAVLRQLHSAPNVTHVWVSWMALDQHRKFLRRMAVEFPLITSFRLNIGGTAEALDNLALFLRLKTNIQELHLWLSPYCIDSWEDCHKAVEDMDFSAQVHLRKLTIDFSIIFPYAYQDGDRWRMPVSTSLAQLANLQELHITVQQPSAVAPLPLWLAKFPAFVRLEIFSEEWHPSLLFLDSVCAMTGLKQLSLEGYLEDGRGMDVIPWLNRLTSLILYSSDDMTPLVVDPFLLVPSLVKLHMPSNMFGRMRTPLPLLKALSLAPPGFIADPAKYFELAPSLRSLLPGALGEGGVAPPGKPHSAHLPLLPLSEAP